MNVLVYSGIAQLVAMEIWPSVIDLGAVATLSALTAVIGSRLFLDERRDAAVVRQNSARGRSIPTLFMLTDAVLADRDALPREGGRDPGVYFGAAIMHHARLDRRRQWSAISSAGYRRSEAATASIW